MGYTTVFEGEIIIVPHLDDETNNLINGLSKTRRMKRNLKKLAEMLNITEDECFQKYGTEVEFYFNPISNNFGQEHDMSIIDYNNPPSTQPSLWLQWIVEDKNRIIWSGGEKFYEYVEWLEYLINKILKPIGYICNGKISFEGEDEDDYGIIIVKNNKVKVKFNK